MLTEMQTAPTGWPFPMGGTLALLAGACLLFVMLMWIFGVFKTSGHK